MGNGLIFFLCFQKSKIIKIKLVYFSENIFF